jgi:hypothetical protein
LLSTDLTGAGHIEADKKKKEKKEEKNYRC